jgi:hypothetical protein
MDVLSYGMARPQVVGGGDGLQMWWVAANILSKQSWIPAKSGHPAWGWSYHKHRA